MTHPYRSLASDVPQCDWGRLVDCVEQLEHAWESGASPDWSRYLPASTTENLNAIAAELIKVDQEYRWRRGERRLVEDYLPKCPADVVDGRLLIDLLHGESRTRLEIGESLDVAELHRRYPKLVDDPCFLAMIAAVRSEMEARTSTRRPPSKIADDSAAETLAGEDGAAPDGTSFGRV